MRVLVKNRITKNKIIANANNIFKNTIIFVYNHLRLKEISQEQKLCWAFSRSWALALRLNQ